MERGGAEAEAKACLVQYLRSTQQITFRTAIALELGIAKQANRADVAVITNLLTSFEIKTHSDNLRRLEAQLQSYEAAADLVTVVAATRHINAVLSRVPGYVGVLELLRIGGRAQIRPIREATRSPNWRASAALELLPANEIRKRLFQGEGPKRRSDLIEAVSRVSAEQQHKAVIDFLRERYIPSTRAFLRKVRRRAVYADDLAGLRIWNSLIEPSPEIITRNGTPTDLAYLLHVGKSFGPVPDEVKELLDR